MTSAASPKRSGDTDEQSAAHSSSTTMATDTVVIDDADLPPLPLLYEPTPRLGDKAATLAAELLDEAAFQGVISGAVNTDAQARQLLADIAATSFTLTFTTQFGNETQLHRLSVHPRTKAEVVLRFLDELATRATPVCSSTMAPANWRCRRGQSARWRSSAYAATPTSACARHSIATR